MSMSLSHDFISSPMSMVHVINHSRNTLAPNVVYYDQTTGIRVSGTEQVTSPNQVIITLFTLRALYVSVH